MELGQVPINQCELKQEDEKLQNLTKKKVICDSLQLDKQNKHHVYFFDKQYYKNQELLLEYQQLDDQAWNARGSCP